ncbi:unnamed protein product [Trichobilharzia szidati]|nr:unnamed protein product [Trichobilharzia szidati]
MILISFHREGTTLLEKEVLKMFVSGLLKISAHFLRTMAGIPSGPRLWEGLRDFKHLRTSEVLKLLKSLVMLFVTLKLEGTLGRRIKDLLRVFTSIEGEQELCLPQPVISLKSFHMFPGVLHDKIL